MNKKLLREVARRMVTSPKGILAIDERTATCAKRFKSVGLRCTPESRRRYRRMLVTARGLNKYISGVILYEETFRQKADAKRIIPRLLRSKGILPGIKVDEGAKPMALFSGERITEGLDGLRERLKEYKSLGAAFAKWRAVITIKGKKIPTAQCIRSNAHALARYAGLCQEQGLVPIVEPEVLMEGDHSIERCEEVTRQTLKVLFEELILLRVDLGGLILKASMVLPGKLSKKKVEPKTIADRTIAVLKACVPKQVPGIVFLSGGISDEDATLFLDLMHKRHRRLPWVLTFSYGRALQREPLRIWAKTKDAKAAQQALIKRARENDLASTGSL